MARKPSAKTAVAPPPSFEAETQEFKERLAAARAQKDAVKADIAEAYFFTNPRLARVVSSNVPPTKRTANDDAELATDLATELSVDFATEVRSGFFPEQVNWVKSAPGETVDENAWKDAEEEIKARDATIFRAIRSSGFDGTLSTALIPDFSVGTLALMINDPVPSQPISVMHVPLRELEINVGRDGKVDDRFAVRWVRARHVAGLLPGVTIPEKLKKDIDAKPNKMVCVAWGWWRDWSEPADLVWKHCVAVDNQVLASDEKKGEGSCGLIVMRFMPHALSPWGNGPTIQTLPKLRVLDAATAATQDRFDIAMSPPLGYPDDGVTNFGDGIEAGKAYGMRPGSGRDIAKLYFEGDPDFAFYTLADLERSIRRAHFADYPQQRGDTPPTATQWADEMVMSQRRIGTPGVAFWPEGPAEVFKRYSYLLTERGTIRPVQIGGRDVTLVPENPATRAQEQLEVQGAVRLLQICMSLMPETSQAAIDQLATIENLKAKTGDKIVELRGKAVVEGLVQQILTQASGAAGGQASTPAQ